MDIFVVYGGIFVAILIIIDWIISSSPGKTKKVFSMFDKLDDIEAENIHDEEMRKKKYIAKRKAIQTHRFNKSGALSKKQLEALSTILSDDYASSHGGVPSEKPVPLKVSGRKDGMLQAEIEKDVMEREIKRIQQNMKKRRENRMSFKEKSGSIETAK
ncbi:hypothetical protein ADUPG1_012623 [Aduncisulcus paluster]|uniref:Uncharacterized protein n=1 Tax=Aduncisulcus paluster TaxID=2918883 RepID=A0ABQ5K030_9EUKA|nr:hypothetical protein ADUPG1_012623 [Aduncisulcus paluster]